LQNNGHHKFIEPHDALAALINEKANDLYEQLRTFDVNSTGIDEYGKNYFTGHHGGSRLFFSVQSSADIIYRSVLLVKKDIGHTSFIDYGAGLGTLFLLAGKLGFQKVYFNDYFPQWAGYAKMLCDALGSKVDDFISGDIDEVIGYAKKNNVFIDIVASRNVIEHIYDLRAFYTKLQQSELTGISYSTTTANYHNLPMRLKHYRHHHKLEKLLYIKQRRDHLREKIPGLNATDEKQLIALTRGRAFADLTNAIDLYLAKKPVPPVAFLRTNTCDCQTGVWAEHLLTRQEYFRIIEESGCEATYTAGFWDTHYKYAVVNLVTRLLNSLIKAAGSKGYWFAPFVNVVTTKKQHG